MEIAYVLPVRKGGLGNQMFQVAAAIVYQEEKGNTVLIPNEFYNSHNTRKQEYAETVFRSFLNRTAVSMDQDMIDKFLSWSFTKHSISPDLMPGPQKISQGMSYFMDISSTSLPLNVMNRKFETFILQD